VQIGTRIEYDGRIWLQMQVMLCISHWNVSVGPSCSEVKPVSRRYHLFELSSSSSSSSQWCIWSKWDQKYCGTAEMQKMFQFQHKWVWRLTSLGPFIFL